MLAQVAIQSGRHAARSVLALSQGAAPAAFHYRNMGTMAVLGRGEAVARIGPVHLSGLPGWLVWLGLHIARTRGLRTKATVLLGWVSGFVFADRPVRLITGPAVPKAAPPRAPPPGHISGEASPPAPRPR